MALSLCFAAGCATTPPPVAAPVDDRPVAEPGSVPTVEPKAGSIVAVDDEELSEGNEIERQMEAFRADVAMRLDALSGELNDCYLPELKRDPSLAGYIVVEMTVGPGGKVSSGPRVTETTLRNKAVETCVVDMVRAQPYPEPINGSFTDVSRVFQFGAF